MQFLKKCRAVFSTYFVIIFLLPFFAASAAGETVKYYQKNVSGLKYLTVHINGMPFEMVFDTGSSHMVVNAEAMQKLGISKFSKKLSGDSVNGTVQSYCFIAGSVKVGATEIRDVEIHYIPNSKMNLLGGTFLSNFNYFVSERDKSITFFPYSSKYISEKDSYFYLNIGNEENIEK